jgi:hypothetical protein
VRKAQRIAAVSAAVVVLLLVLAQLLLPGIAADRISSRLARYGHVDSVDVNAFPAVELLWEHADTVRVHASDLTLGIAQTGRVLREGGGARDIDMSAARVRVGPLALSEVSFHKRGSRLVASALASEDAVAEALPPGVSVRLLRSDAGAVEVSVEGSLFGVGGEVDAIAQASEGKLIARPTNALLRLFSLTLYENPHVYIEGIAAIRTSTPAPGYRLTMLARLQ